MIFLIDLWMRYIHPKVMKQAALAGHHSPQISQFLEIVPDDCKFNCLFDNYVIKIIVDSDPLVSYSSFRY